jgi:hypothetical protein
MVEVQDVQEKVQEKLQGTGGGTALKAAAAAAATGAATYAVRRAFAHDGDGEKSSRADSSSGKSGAGSSLLASAAASGWDAAAEVLIPLAEDAAEAAGKYVATHGPEVLRERIVPKFVEAFNDAR